MPSSSCHLPNGQTFQVTPVFGGVSFKSNDMNFHHSALPPGWTIVIYTNSRRDVEEKRGRSAAGSENSTSSPATRERESDKEQGRVEGDERSVEQSDDDSDDSSDNDSDGDGDGLGITRFTRPTLRDDCFYISYTVNPPDTEYKPASSPSRQIAMMLWATLWWYFHEPEPDLHVSTEASTRTPREGQPKGDWRVNIKQEGILKGRNLMQKLERMGLVASEDSWVGLDPVVDTAEWSHMFVSRRTFWQLDPRIFLFTLSPKASPSPSAQTFPSRGVASMGPGEYTLYHATGGPFTSGSHLPTYFPPAPTQFTYTDGIRHPIRQKPPRQGQVFYIRYVPSMGQYLSFRVPFLPPPAIAPSSSSSSRPANKSSSSSSASTPSTSSHAHDASIASIEERLFPNMPSDIEFLHKWMNDPRVDVAWGEAGPQSKQEEFLRHNLTSRHSFPVIGCWNGRPFGYFEVYWVKEDRLGRALGNSVDNYDRGIHVLVGEQEFRGFHRVAVWLSALVHFCWLADMRTQSVYLEPRIDNEKLINYLQKVGFYKEGEVSFPHKQSAVMRIKRDFWEAPVQ